MPLVNEKAWCCWQLCCEHVDNCPKDRVELQDGADLREWQRNPKLGETEEFLSKSVDWVYVGGGDSRDV